MTDVLFFNTADGGEVEVVNGVMTLDDGWATAAYLSLFGGNSEDSGDEAEGPLQWWGNVGETDPARKYRSEFQYLLTSLPAITSNLVRLEEAAVRDLTRTFDGIADRITARASMPALNRLAVAINIEVNNVTRTFMLASAWGSTQ